MIDTGPVLAPEPAYAALALVACVWSISQIYWFIQTPTPWRFSTALWMMAKFMYFTFVGSVFWFNWFNSTIHSLVVWSFALIHLAVFIHWAHLPHINDDSSETPKET